MSSLRLAFMGTPDFAAPVLTALLEAGHAVAQVYTQPPRPAGRGQRALRSPIHRLAEKRGLPVRTPPTLRDPDEQAHFAALGLDSAVVAAYGLILPAAILSAPRLGCVNVHASLLPRWRGAAPIQRAILAGDEETGITIMQMDDGLDTGGVLCRKSVRVPADMDGGVLHDALAALGARLVVEALGQLAAGRLRAVPQPAEGVTYAAKIDKSETRIDWREPTGALVRKVRAFAPLPGAWFMIANERIRVLAAEAVEDSEARGNATPGTVLNGRFLVACGKGALRILRVQRAGGKPLEAAAFLRGRPLPAGTVLA